MSFPPNQMMGGGPVLVLNSKTQRQTGREAVLGNIRAARAVADIVRTTLGPRSMLKMLLDPMGSIILTNDGHAILREVDVSHPAAKSMIELSRAQDEEVGDGTTSVIVLAAQVLVHAEPFLLHPAGSGGLHPTVIVAAYTKALQVAMNIMEQQAVTVDVRNDTDWMKQLVTTTVGTKFSSRWNERMVDMALKAVLTVAQPRRRQKQRRTASGTNEEEDNAETTKKSDANLLPVALFDGATRENMMEVDIKRYAKVEKIPGGQLEDSEVLDGVMFNKDTVHSSMRRRIENPRILLLDTPLEYKKGETSTNMELSNENDFNTLLKQEEEAVAQICRDIIQHKPDIVITEKGVSDLAQHYLAKANITAFRRLRKTDNNRIARAVGATVVSRTDEITEDDIGKGCGLFEMRKVNDNDWFCYLVQCKNPTACTIVLRGGSKDVLNEMERNLQDAMLVIRNVVLDPRLVCGGGAIEMAVSVGLKQYGRNNIKGIQQAPFQAIGEAMEVIPRTLAQNCGVSVIRTITQLRARHADQTNMNEDGTKDAATANGGLSEPSGVESSSNSSGRCTWGVHGVTGQVVDMQEYGVWEPLAVKTQTIKTAIESACMILRIDDIVSGSKKRA